MGMTPRSAGILFSSFSIFGVLIIGFEPFLGWQLICFITGLCYLWVEKYVDKYLEGSEEEQYDYPPLYFMLRGIVVPSIVILVLEISNELPFLEYIKFYLIGYLLCHVVFALRTGLSSN